MKTTGEALVVRTLDHILAAARPEQFPDLGIPEVAFVGKSNVGKSSLLNTLTGRRKLARVSSTPGRTQCIHFYKLNSALGFVDVPGYGYAKVSKEQRMAWRGLMEAYLGRRTPLVGVVLIVDIRRDFEEEEQSLLAYLALGEVPVQVVATKCDKLPRSAIFGRINALRTALGPHRAAPIAFSAETSLGKDELWRAVLRWLPEETRERIR